MSPHFSESLARQLTQIDTPKLLHMKPSMVVVCPHSSQAWVTEVLGSSSQSLLPSSSDWPTKAELEAFSFRYASNALIGAKGF